MTSEEAYPPVESFRVGQDLGGVIDVKLFRTKHSKVSDLGLELFPLIKFALH
jgi:hypothetical protein